LIQSYKRPFKYLREIREFRQTSLSKNIRLSYLNPILIKVELTMILLLTLEWLLLMQLNRN